MMISFSEQIAFGTKLSSIWYQAKVLLKGLN